MLPSGSTIIRRAITAGLLKPAALCVLDDLPGADSLASEKDVADLLIHEGLVSPYQADMLLRGRKMFFVGPCKIIDLLGEDDRCRAYQAIDRTTNEERLLYVLPGKKASGETLTLLQKSIAEGTLPGKRPGRLEEIRDVNDFQVAIVRPIESKIQQATIEPTKPTAARHINVIRKDRPRAPARASICAPTPAEVDASPTRLEIATIPLADEPVLLGEHDSYDLQPAPAVPDRPAKRHETATISGDFNDLPALNGAVDDLPLLDDTHSNGAGGVDVAALLEAPDLPELRNRSKWGDVSPLPIETGVVAVGEYSMARPKSKKIQQSENKLIPYLLGGVVAVLAIFILMGILRQGL